MARSSKARSSLSLFPGRPTRERAWELVAKFPLGSRIDSVYTTVKGKKYGPYYRACFVVDGKERKLHVGAEQDKQELEAAWQLIAEELQAAEAAPDVQRLRELEAKAGKRALARTVPVPIYDEVAMRRPK